MRSSAPPGVLASWAALLVAAVPAPASNACDADALGALRPAPGEVLSSSALPTSEEVVREVDLSVDLAACQPEESDPSCKSRLTAEHVGRAGDGQELRVDLEGPTLGVLAVLRGSAGETEGLFASYEELADHLETPVARAAGLQLVRAEPALDRALRTATVRVVEARAEQVEIAAGTRLIYRPVGSSLDALTAVREAAAPLSATIVRWQPRDDGTVEIDLRCPR